MGESNLGFELKSLREQFGDLGKFTEDLANEHNTLVANHEQLKEEYDQLKDSVSKEIKEVLRSQVNESNAQLSLLVQAHESELKAQSDRLYAEFKSQLFENQAKWVTIFTTIVSVFILGLFALAANFTQTHIFHTMDTQYDSLKERVETTLKSVEDKQPIATKK